jgi:outer membrane immunogenic protein
VRKLLLGGVAVAAITLAVDGPVQAAPPAYNWTGCYIGGNVGGGWANKDFGAQPAAPAGFLGASSAPSGFAGGGQLGCDVRNGMWVFGLQGLFDWASMSGDTPFFNGKGFATRVPWFASATGRIGYLLQPGLLVFARAGAAFVHDRFTFSDGVGTATSSQTRSGPLVGGGFEWLFAPNWSVTIEYGYAGFGSSNVRIDSRFVFDDRISQHMQVVLVGLNYRFGSTGRP